jgi:hypothetical protein
MRGELDLHGVFVPALLAFAFAAWLVTIVLRRLLAATGFYRLVWHRPLFDTALFVLVLGGLVALLSRMPT